MTALHWACLKGQIATAKLLVANGANVEAQNKVWQGDKGCCNTTVRHWLGWRALMGVVWTIFGLWRAFSHVHLALFGIAIPHAAALGMPNGKDGHGGPTDSQGSQFGSEG